MGCSEKSEDGIELYYQVAGRGYMRRSISYATLIDLFLFYVLDHGFNFLCPFSWFVNSHSTSLRAYTYVGLIRYWSHGRLFWWTPKATFDQKDGKTGDGTQVGHDHADHRKWWF